MALAESCTGLRKVYLRNCKSVTDVGVGALAVNCSDLREIMLRGCIGVTDKGIQKLAENCKNLTLMNLRGCGLSYNGVNWFLENNHSL